MEDLFYGIAVTRATRESEASQQAEKPLYSSESNSESIRDSPPSPTATLIIDKRKANYMSAALWRGAPRGLGLFGATVRYRRDGPAEWRPLYRLRLTPSALTL